jgi:hypothetical protein
MKIYFTTALRGKKIYGKNYRAIVEVLEKLGYEVTFNDVFEEGVEERVFNQTIVENESAHKRLLRLLKDADVMVAEVSIPSTALGYEITEALYLDKPVIALHTHEGNSPKLLTGRKDEKFQMVEYDLDGLGTILKQVLYDAGQMLDVRFNFFINPKLLDFLNWIAKEKQVSKSVYIREVLLREMENNKKYNN